MRYFDPTKKVRPMWDDFSQKMAGGYVLCACGDVCQTVEGLHHHWDLGHFDVIPEEEIHELV